MILHPSPVMINIFLTNEDRENPTVVWLDMVVYFCFFTNKDILDPTIMYSYHRYPSKKISLWKEKKITSLKKNTKWQMEWYSAICIPKKQHFLGQRESPPIARNIFSHFWGAKDRAHYLPLDFVPMESISNNGDSPGKSDEPLISLSLMVKIFWIKDWTQGQENKRKFELI